MSKLAKLYQSIRPKHYDLLIKLSDNKRSFDGEVEIHFQKVGPISKRITLHSKDLKIGAVELQKQDKNSKSWQTLEVQRINLHKSQEQLRIHTVENLHTGQYRAKIKFNGKITTHMDGVYTCDFEHNGQKKQLIATQFESHYARQAFNTPPTRLPSATLSKLTAKPANPVAN